MWQQIIPAICKRLDELGVQYHADASSSLFVNGFEFEMDDFDVTVEWGSIERVHHAFRSQHPTDVLGTSPKQFCFEFLGHKIDVMSYQSETGIGPESERLLVSFAGTKVWSKKPSFYLNRMRKNHPMRESALQYFRMNNVL